MNLRMLHAMAGRGMEVCIYLWVWLSCRRRPCAHEPKASNMCVRKSVLPNTLAPVR